MAKRWTLKRQDRAFYHLDKVLHIIYETEDGYSPAEHALLRAALSNLQALMMGAIEREGRARRGKRS